MKITETIQRECCQSNDLLILGDGKSHKDYRFCKYCGRHFEKEYEMDASGNGYNYSWKKLKWPWE